ncbi:MAG: hypothetical protein KDB10_21005, partial [Acidimicrobiales bacterium]|nr:hypothetical protein [Acidimicrobiales bacterium]
MTRRALIAACALALVVAAGPADARTGDVTGHRQSRAATAGPIPGAVRSVSAGHGHSCALLRDGAVKCWGHNDYGQLGLGDDENRGDQPGEMGADLPTVELGTGRTATAVSAGADHTCALLDDGTVRCWGRGERLGLGLGHTQDRGDDPGEMGDALAPVDLGTGRTATRISAGVNHTCALLDDATVKCWGDNGHGRLGLGDTATRGDQPGEMGDALPAVDLGTGRTATAVFAGGAHSCARLDDGSVKCWGSGEFGMLGLGDVGNRGDSPGEMGDQIPALDLGTGRTVTAIGHACALLDDATVKCWGDNSAGQLGQGDEVRRGDDPGEMGDHLPTVDLGTGRTVTAISDDGYGHPCALLDDGTLRCWGPNWRGRLGLGDTDDRGDEPGEMGDQLAPVDLGDGLRAVEVDSGTEHECARLDDATVKCW